MVFLLLVNSLGSCEGDDSDDFVRTKEEEVKSIAEAAEANYFNSCGTVHNYGLPGLFNPVQPTEPNLASSLFLVSNFASCRRLFCFDRPSPEIYGLRVDFVAPWMMTDGLQLILQNS